VAGIVDAWRQSLICRMAFLWRNRHYGDCSGTSNGNSDKRTHGTLHWDNNGEHASYGGSTFTSKNNFNEEFYVFSIIWNETSIKWLLDDSQFHETEITSEQMSEFRDSFFFIFNVAVGGKLAW